VSGCSSIIPVMRRCGSRTRAVLAANPDAFFTIPHFDGYSAVLVQLRKVSPEALQDALTDGWLACAPRALADQYAQDHPTRPSPPL